MRLVSYPLTVLAVVAASYGLAQLTARPTVGAAPAVRTSGTPPLTFAPVDRTRRASFAPTPVAPVARASHARLRRLPRVTLSASSAAASSAVGTAVAFASDPWSRLLPAGSNAGAAESVAVLSYGHP